MKKCSKCGVEYPATSEYFPKHPSVTNGLTARCKQCVAAYKKQWCKDNVEKKRAAGRRWSENNREKDRENHKIWHENNPGKANEYYRKYRKNNPEARAASCRKYVETHPVERTAANRKWAQNNPDKRKVSVQRRLTRKKSLPSTLTTEQWTAVKEEFGGTCCYCGKEKPLTIDHFVPVNNMGELSIDNVLPACISCNCSKGAREFRSWFKLQTFYSKSREQKIMKYLNYKNGIQQLTLL